MPRIAVVNDDTTFLSLMQALLEDKGCDAFIIRESSSAYPTLKRDRPDLVILDIRMESPETGWGILELLKLDPETRNIPVIVCSAALDKLRVMESWLEDHGVDTLPKPFDIDDLYSRVDTALARSRTSLQSV